MNSRGIDEFLLLQLEKDGSITLEDNGGYTDIDFVKEGFQSVKKFLKGEYK